MLLIMYPRPSRLPTWFTLRAECKLGENHICSTPALRRRGGKWLHMLCTTTLDKKQVDPHQPPVFYNQLVVFGAVYIHYITSVRLLDICRCSFIRVCNPTPQFPETNWAIPYLYLSPSFLQLPSPRPIVNAEGGPLSCNSATSLAARLK